MTEKPIVFVSCGQITKEEKELGRAVCQFVTEHTSYEPYFAENQTSLDGLTKNILGALDRCVGLIVIMHPRGTVTFPEGQHITRGSIWIEQEIAIAAFLTQVLGRDLQVASYIHTDIHREGMRDKLQLNPIAFRDHSEVLENLRGKLPGWKDISAPVQSATSPKLKVVLEYGTVSNFLFDITNNGDEEIISEEIKLQHREIELTDPLTPDTPNLWKVPPRSGRSFGKNIAIQQHPGITLKQAMDGPGNKADLKVILPVRYKGKSHEIQKTLRVGIGGDNEIFQYKG